MASKVYAVREGRRTGIFNSWKECEQQVKGYSGAEYKSFKTFDEAGEYLNYSNELLCEKEEDNSNSTIMTYNDTMIAYVDGSYDDSIRQFGSGIVILFNGEEKTFSIRGTDESLIDMRNVAGEIKGAEKAMQYAVDNNVNRLIIYYDYEGIEKWCIRAWSARKEGTKKYRDFYDEVSKKVNIQFVKVKAHSGDKYNEEADKLAKESLGM
ncbi:ribonuclease H [Clostridium tepidiprofundi DSM 19306]|uniref:Ribonuclease H n=1 Tax=Clostridium tepidiprofundi DSM 19306 TaxID=1121338 RepID=A0A151B370_9CLOT|nr:ribonuclease H family protein [Clostridium tepidiprofundi]KYH34202.1 ribonuclease H [Clostridium tepidiprofundi DSM 19306]